MAALSHFHQRVYGLTGRPSAGTRHRAARQFPARAVATGRSWPPGTGRFTNPSSAVVCEAAVGLHQTRDPFDRLLAAHAIADGMVLVTKDKTIRQHLSLAWWAE